MNENNSDSERKYLPRWITKTVEKAIKDHPVLVITGARQVGKSTFLRHAEPTRSWRYVSFDDFSALGQAERDPASLWAGTEYIVLDEVQKAPNVLSAVKQEVDNRRRKFHVVLSGSANLLLMQKVSESLAGRAVYLTFWPMTLGEVANKPAPNILENLLQGKFPEEGSIKEKSQDPLEIIGRGLMPPLLDLPDHAAVISWWEGYVATYLERDLRQISRVTSLSDFRRLMESVALRSGQLVHQSDIARETGVSQPSVHRYINLLEETCIMHRVPAFARNKKKRLVKSPKFYWVDAGLAIYLAGYFDIAAIREARERGGFMETLILQHLRALAQLLVPRPAIFYWRTTTGHEVDFVIEHGRQLIAIEVKLSSTPRYSDCEGLRLFLQEYPETRCGILVHTGKTIQRLAEKIIAIPWNLLCGI